MKTDTQDNTAQQWEALANEAIADVAYWKAQALQLRVALEDVRKAFYVDGTRKALLAAMERSKIVLTSAKAYSP